VVLVPVEQASVRYRVPYDVPGRGGSEEEWYQWNRRAEVGPIISI
jgi:hypothetical protein